MRVAVIADTHIPARASGVPPACRDRLAAADLILHAGDVLAVSALIALRAIGPPLVAVRGNADDAAVKEAMALGQTSEALRKWAIDFAASRKK